MRFSHRLIRRGETTKRYQHLPVSPHRRHNMKNLKDQFEDWKRSEGEKLSPHTLGTETTKSKRTYVHFDLRRKKDYLTTYRGIFLNPDKIKSEITFWPFLKINLIEPRIKNSPKGIPRKKELKIRSVYYASHQDALLYSWYSYRLNMFYEISLQKHNISQNVIAYRKIPREDFSKKNKCNIHFAKEVFDFIKDYDEDCVAVVADITGFFDNLDHDHLKFELKQILGIPENEKLPDDYEIIYKNLTKFKYVDAEQVYKAFGIKIVDKKIKIDGKTRIVKIPTINNARIQSILQPNFTRKDFISRVVKANLIKGNEHWNMDKKCHKGIMQGAPISATFANIYMISFDKKIAEFAAKIGGLYRRYSDDIVIVCSTENFKDVQKKLYDEITNAYLEINPKKVSTTFFKKENGEKLNSYNETNTHKKMQYLGFEFDGTNIFLRPKSLSNYYRKMKSKIRKSICMAFGKKSKTKYKKNIVFKKALHERFLKNGKRSFISYALRANKIMGGNTIDKQLSNRNEIMDIYMKKKKRKHYARLFSLTAKSTVASNKAKTSDIPSKKVNV